MMATVEMYKQDLEVFAHMQLPRFHMASSFHDRADSSLLLLVRQSPYIHTLVMIMISNGENNDSDNPCIIANLALH